MKTTAFDVKDKAGKLVPHPPEVAAVNLLMRTKGWAKVVAEGFCKTLLPDELQALAALESSAIVTGDEVNAILDEVEDREAKKLVGKEQETATEQPDVEPPDPIDLE